MKIEMTKKGMQRWAQPGDVERFKDAGWQLANQAQSKELAGEEIIRLKPPTVKSKATVTAVEEANITNKGDE
jgi:hypothetical protein